MGGKKKAAAKKGAADDGPDESFPNFLKKYKKACTDLGVDYSKVIKAGKEAYDEEEKPMTKFIFWEELGWVGVKAIFDSLRSVA